jgi:hypothetical protein
VAAGPSVIPATKLHVPSVRAGIVPRDGLVELLVRGRAQANAARRAGRLRQDDAARRVVGVSGRGARVSDANQRVLLHRARSKVRAALEDYFGAVEVAVA